MKKVALTVIVFVLFLLSVPAALFAAGAVIPAQFDESYYAELQDMYGRLSKAEKKKIVIVGTSSVAFGVDVRALESEFPDYTVCPFGLYGAIGTKAMMDMSERAVKKGDIVILSPELGEQTMSMYFGGEYMWKALDGRFDMLTALPGEDLEKMPGSYASFLSQKFSYFAGGSKPPVEGVYDRTSFDETCTMVYERAGNIMPGGFDAVNPLSFDTSVMSADFAEYAAGYAERIRAKGAEFIFGFCPVNERSLVSGTTSDKIDGYADFIYDRLGCDFLGCPQNYIFEAEYFYDSNVHVNSAGSKLYTRALARDLKAHFGDNSEVSIAVPEKPPFVDVLPDTGDWDNSDAWLFEYEEIETVANGIRLTGLKNAVKKKITVPSEIDGKRVISFAPSVFAGNTTVQEIVLQSVRTVEAGAFAGCSSLATLRIAEGVSPGYIRPAEKMLDGTSGVRILVPNASVPAYLNDYYWGHFGDYIFGY